MRRDVQDPESIADHMYRMGIMALIASDIPGIDRDKLVLFFSLVFGEQIQLLHWLRCFSFFVLIFVFRCVKMAIVHDIAEG